MLRRFRGRHLLLLQGPNGLFFRNVARHLERFGARVSKVNFNPGDTLFFRGPNVVYYRGDIAAWPEFFSQLVRERKIDAVLLFGDCRAYHRLAIEQSHALDLDVYVFEEGYLRPDFITFERDGVNGHSRLSRDPEFYREIHPKALPNPRPVGDVFPRAAWFSGTYALANTLFGWRYPYYQHHRDLNAVRQAGYWLRGGIRRALHAMRDREINARLVAGTMPPYFLVPLQVHLDSQIGHSSFKTVGEFIELVVGSFAAHAPADTTLILKHHPFDRPYRDYGALINRLRSALALGSRLVYVDVINLPAALRHARGTVVINSTVGLSSVHHGTPVKCLSSPVYDIPGLTHQGPLSSFWREPGAVDANLFRSFRYFLRRNNQINGSVWSDVYPEGQPEQALPPEIDAPLDDGNQKTAPT